MKEESQEFLSSTEQMIKYLPGNKTPIIMLNDNHAVWVEDNKIEILNL